MRVLELHTLVAYKAKDSDEVQQAMVIATRTSGHRTLYQIQVVGEMFTKSDIIREALFAEGDKVELKWCRTSKWLEETFLFLGIGTWNSKHKFAVTSTSWKQRNEWKGHKYVYDVRHVFHNDVHSEAAVEAKYKLDMEIQSAYHRGFETGHTAGTTEMESKVCETAFEKSKAHSDGFKKGYQRCVDDMELEVLEKIKRRAENGEY